jgi:hypothetical protein
MEYFLNVWAQIMKKSLKSDSGVDEGGEILAE